MVHPNWSSNQGGRNVCYTVTTHKQIVLLQYKARNPIYICNQGFTNIASWHTFIQKTKFGLLIKKDAQRKQVNEQAPTGFPDFRHWRMLHNPPKLKVQCHITSPSGQKPSFVRKVCSSNCTWCAENGECRSIVSYLFRTLCSYCLTSQSIEKKNRRERCN